MTPTVIHGDCLEVLPTLAADSIDACVTDPPYGLEFMGKEWDKFRAPSNAWATRDKSQDLTGKTSSPFLAAQVNKYQAGVPFQVWCEQWAREVYRVLKPGAHLLAFGGTRTYHRMACAIEDAGFEVRDCIMWVYGSGFPKSHDVSKAIDRAEREELGREKNWGVSRIADGKTGYGDYAGDWAITAPSTDAARQWQGWGTALKPACEPIIVARKPLSEKTIAANVLKWGTGAINVDGCRIDLDGDDTRRKPVPSTGWCIASPTAGSMDDSALRGRWPANLIHDGSEEVTRLFPETQSGELKPEHQARGGFAHPNCYHAGSTKGGGGYWPNRNGSAARFFYTAKADADDRLGSKHPTVKPVDLIAYLVRLVTPAGGTVLDPFAGSGTTGMACMREGFNCILIEREAEYVFDIKRRLNHVHGTDMPLFTDSASVTAQ